VDFINRAFTTLFDYILAPFDLLPPFWALTLFSAVIGIIFLLMYGKVSNQAGLKNVKRQIYSYVLESILFKNDLRLSLKAQGKMFVGGLRYFSLAFPPIIILAIPCILILAQLNLRYSHRPLQAGEHAIVKVTLNSDTSLFETNLTASEGATLTPPLRDLNDDSISWRVGVPTTATKVPLMTLSVSETSFQKPLLVNTSTTKIPTEASTSWWWQFFYPGDSIPESLKDLVSAITITYPEQDLSIAGTTFNWLLVFAVVSIVAGLVGSKYLKVEI